MVLTNKLFQIPAPFDDFTERWKYSDEAEWVDSIEWQTVQGNIRQIRRTDCADGIDDFAPADGFAANARRDGIPVNERKRCALVVDGDPRSSTRFRGSEHSASVHRLSLRRQPGGARQLFVAVHPQAIAPLPRNERDGAHRLVQSAAG